jgi:hypothetical protein
MSRGRVERRADGLRIEIPAKRESGFLAFLAASGLRMDAYPGFLQSLFGGLWRAVRWSS